MINNNRSQHVHVLSLVFLLVLSSYFLLLKADHSPPTKDPAEGSLTAIKKLSVGLRGGGGGRSMSRGSGAKGGGSSRSPLGRKPFYGAAAAGSSGSKDHKRSAASNDDARCSLSTVLTATILGTFIVAQYIM